MSLIFTEEEMRSYEGYLMETLGIPSLLLMERAAGYISKKVFEHIRQLADAHVVVVCGCGNNGADGMAAARLLAEYENVRISVVQIGDPSRRSESNKIQAQILEHMGIRITYDPEEVLQKHTDVIVDAIFGIGINRDLSDVYLDAVRSINAYREAHSDCYVIAVDLPSGLHTDLGIPQPDAVVADETVTFGYPKRGILLREGRRYCGAVTCGGIGIPQPDSACADRVMEWGEICKLMPKRDLLGHKGTFGKVLCIAGSAGMPGAAILNAAAVLRSGAGMVKVIGVSQNRDLMMQAVPEAMFVAMDDEIDEEALAAELHWADTVLLGSGLTKERAGAFLKSTALKDCEKPMVIDADGLNALAEQKKFLMARKESGRITYLTPHPGEFRRLFPETEPHAEQQPDTVRGLAKEYGVILLAKSATTLVANGDKIYYNAMGSDALATAGSGDVLAGALAAVVCVINDPLMAAVYADILHAMAGRAAAQQSGNAGVTASDLIRALPAVMQR